MQAANGFMLIIQCNQAKILFVSDTVSEVLSEEPDSWIGSCLYDLLHPKVYYIACICAYYEKNTFLGYSESKRAIKLL